MYSTVTINSSKATVDVKLMFCLRIQNYNIVHSYNYQAATHDSTDYYNVINHGNEIQNIANISMGINNPLFMSLKLSWNHYVYYNALTGLIYSTKEKKDHIHRKWD